MIEVIASLHNAKIKLAASLKQKKYRDEMGLFLSEGIRLSEEAVDSDCAIRFCICTADSLENPRVVELKARLEQKNCPLYQVAKAIYDKISDTKEPQGILLVIEKPTVDLADLVRPNEVNSIIVLDGLQDPGNVGTIIRTADAAKCSGVILLDQTVDVYSAKAIRATMGSVFHLPVIQNVSIQDLLYFMLRYEMPLFVAALDHAAKSYFMIDFTKSFAVVLGNEGNGVREEIIEQCSASFFIPMPGQAESLNVATAASLVIYEGLRQRIAKKLL